MDNYSPIPAFMIFAQNILSLYENWSIFRPFRDAVRKKGLTFCAEYMKAEDQQTNFIDIGRTLRFAIVLFSENLSGLLCYVERPGQQGIESGCCFSR